MDKKPVLFIDDEESVLHALERSLIDEPYQCIYASDPNIALPTRIIRAYLHSLQTLIEHRGFIRREWFRWSSPRLALEGGGCE